MSGAEYGEAMTACSVRRFALSGVIGAGAGVGLAATTLATSYATPEVPWGLMIYGGPIGAGIGAVTGVGVWLLARGAHTLAGRRGLRSAWAVAVAVALASAAGCATLGCITLQAGVPAVTIGGSITLGLIAAAGSLAESIARTKSPSR